MVLLLVSLGPRYTSRKTVWKWEWFLSLLPIVSHYLLVGMGYLSLSEFRCIVTNLLVHLVCSRQQPGPRLIQLLLDQLLQLLGILGQMCVQLHGGEWQLILQVTCVVEVGGSEGEKRVVGLALWVPVCPCFLIFVSSFSSQLLVLRLYRNFRPTSDEETTAFHRIPQHLPQLSKV